MHRDSDKPLSATGLYDISGSANWTNKADIGIAVHWPDITSTTTEIHVQKGRFKAVGKRGITSLRYERATGRYFEMPAAVCTGAARGCADE